MKQLFLIGMLFLATTTLMKAQSKKALEIKRGEMLNDSLVAQDSKSNSAIPQFVLSAHEEAEVDLKFILKDAGDLNVLVKDKNQRVVFSKKYTQKGGNSVNFIMEENQEYTVYMSSKSKTCLAIEIKENI